MDIDPFWIVMGMLGLVIFGPVITTALFALYEIVSTAINDYNPQMAEALAKNHVQHDRYEPTLLTYFNRKIYKPIWEQEALIRTSADQVRKL